jgi:hypothetical protein
LGRGRAPRHVWKTCSFASRKRDRKHQALDRSDPVCRRFCRMSCKTTANTSSDQSVHPSSVKAEIAPGNPSVETKVASDKSTPETAATNGTVSSNTVQQTPSVEEKKMSAAVDKSSDQSSTAKTEGVWRVDAPYVGAKILRLLPGSDGNFQGSYLAGTVTGWLPSSEANTPTSSKAEPSGTWHVRYDKVCLLVNIYPPNFIRYQQHFSLYILHVTRCTMEKRKSHTKTRKSWTATRCVHRAVPIYRISPKYRSIDPADVN